MNSGVLNSVITTKLREFALKLRKACRSGSGVSVGTLSSMKGKMMQEVSLIMTLLLGPPPKPDEVFTWQYADKDGKAQELKIKPKDFAQYISTAKSPISATSIKNMISLVHDPRHEPMSLLTVSRLGNIVGGRPIQYVNVDMGTLKTTCVKMLQAGIPIFFGSDVGQFSDSKSGIMDTELYSYELGLGTSLLGMSKAERLATGESQMTHAMVLTAVHLDEETGRPVRWRVQNSWGADAGEKGWFVMGDSWMDEFVFQAVVDVRFCSKEVKDVLGTEPTVLPLWDPMGSLA
jgi:bleomycin hydrolase